MARHTIIIDADDTLWENNVFFDKAISQFISQLEYLGYTPDYIRHILNETERRNIRQHGYGVRSFRRSLEETYLKLAGNMARREVLERIGQLAAELENTPPEILDGVPETLAYLAKRHRLDPADERGGGGASGQGGALRPAILLRCNRNRAGKKFRHVPAAYRAIQDREIARLDGWEQSPLRHQPSPAGGPERDLNSSSGYLGIGQRGSGKRHGKAADSFYIS